MKIKRFVDKDSRGAMAQVRSALGSEAVILSNKRVGNQIEMVAAIDLDEIAQLAEASALGSPQAPPNLELVNTPANTFGYQQDPGTGPAFGAGRPVDGAGQASDDGPGSSSLGTVMASVHSALVQSGLPDSVATHLVNLLPDTGSLDDAWALAVDWLQEQLRVMPQDQLIDAGGRIALRGTTGAGKTTTLAKLAARFVLRHSKNQLALVTTDCYRVGGQEQLQAFADYLDVPLFVAVDAKELRMALDQLQHKKLVLVDMAGLSQRDLTAVREQDEMLRNSGYDIDSCLVLPATASSRVLDETLEAFGGETTRAIVVSKHDEAAEPGAVVGSLMRHRIPLAYVGTGQKVPQDLVPAGAKSLIDRALENTTERPASLSRTLQDSLSARPTRVRT